jgi:hypothetical protein
MTISDLNETRCEGMDRIHLTQDRDQRRAIVNMELNFLVP